MMKAPLFCMLFIVLLFIGTGAAQTTSDVIRFAEDGGDGTITVTLLISGIEVGGISEVLPEEYKYVTSTHPAEAMSLLSGQVCFAVMGEESIQYTVRGPVEQKGEIAGTWEDFGNGLSGVVHEPTSENVPASATTTSPAPTQSGAGGEIVLLAMAGSLAAVYWRRDFK